MFKGLLCGLLLLHAVFGSCQESRELKAGGSLEAKLVAGKPQSFEISLAAEDFVTYEVDPSGSTVIASVYDPSGAKVRGEKITEKGAHSFAAGPAGRYRVELTAEQSKEKTAQLSARLVSITLTKTISIAQRLSIPAKKPKLESPRILALRADLEAGKAGAVDAFWTEMKEKGTPLVEPLKGNSKMMLVTFVWRGTAGLKNVFVNAGDVALNAPGDFRMRQLRDTDVWFTTVQRPNSERLQYRLVPDAPYIGPPSERSEEEGNFFSTVANAVGEIDPLNPKRFNIDEGEMDAERYRGMSVLEMPNAPVRFWLAKRPGVASGSIDRLTFSSAQLANRRTVWVYTPPSYAKNGKPYPVLFFTDGEAYQGELGLPVTLDNLIAERRIPPVIAVMVDNVPGERSRELTCNRHFADFLHSELAPWVRRLYNATSDPGQTVIGGLSFGGLTAGCTALRHPETFGNVLAQSGSFWWIPPKSEQPYDEDLPQGEEPNWLAQQFVAAPRLPIRFYLSAGSDEIDPSGRGNDITLTSRQLRDVLLSKGYPVEYVEIAGDHDGLNWQTTLPGGLIFLLGDLARGEGASVEKP